MKKLLIIALALAATLALASCGEKKESETAKTTAAPKAQTTTEAVKATESKASAADRLAFLEKGEIYFDINLSSGVFDDLKIKVGDQEVTKSGKIKVNENDKPAVEGTGSDKDIYAVIYSGGLVNQVVIAPKDLQRTLEIYFNTFAKEKSYIYISDKADGFDTTLNSALTEFLKEYLQENDETAKE